MSYESKTSFRRCNSFKLPSSFSFEALFYKVTIGNEFVSTFPFVGIGSLPSLTNSIFLLSISVMVVRLPDDVKRNLIVLRGISEDGICNYDMPYFSSLFFSKPDL
jgi:hypothetical protein